MRASLHVHPNRLPVSAKVIYRKVGISGKKMKGIAVIDLPGWRGPGNTDSRSKLPLVLNVVSGCCSRSYREVSICQGRG